MIFFIYKHCGNIQEDITAFICFHLSQSVTMASRDSHWIMYRHIDHLQNSSTFNIAEITLFN